MTDESTRIMSEEEIEARHRQIEHECEEARTRPVDPQIKARVQAYLRLPYRMEIRGDPEEGYLAEAPELPHCFAAGKTTKEALAVLREAMAAWIESAIIAGDPVPAPSELPEGRFSGRMLLSVPRSLHRALAEQAAREGVSVNQLAGTLIAAGLERERARFLADVERALDTAGIDPGPALEARRLLRALIQALAHGERWEPASDTPGATNPTLALALLRFIGSLPPGALAEFKERLAALEPTSAAGGEAPKRPSRRRSA